MAQRPAAPVDGKVTVYDVATGAALQRWPVDARDLIASGAFAWSPPNDNPATAPVPAWAKGIGAPPAPQDPALTPLGEPVIATRREDAKPAASGAPITRKAKGNA
jgi:hypothetical protein